MFKRACVVAWVATVCAAAFAAPPISPGQTAYLNALAADCPAKNADQTPPATLLTLAESFRHHLPIVNRMRLDDVLARAPSGHVAGCGDSGGAACDAAGYVEAFGKTGLTSLFAESVCQAR